MSGASGTAGAAGVVLDRDGTLVDFVRDPDLGVVTPAFHPDQLRFLPGVLEGLAALQRAGFVLAIATNQPGAAKGEIPRAAIERTNAALVARLAAEGIHVAALEVCLHHEVGGERGDLALAVACDCRKPKSGMLLRLVDRLGLEPSRSWAIGDTPTDVLAARAANLQAAIVANPARCELCRFRGAPAYGTEPDVCEATFDAVARAIAARGGA